MNIGIVHGFVGGGGGTEKTLQAIIELLIEKNHHVTLYTFSKPSINMKGVKVKSTLPFRLPLFGLYQRYSEKNLMDKASNDDIIIQDSGGLAFPTEQKKHVIVYCHNDFQNELEKNTTKYQGVWSIYYKPYAKLSKNFSTLIKHSNIHLIANSNFIQSSLKTKYNKDSIVIYPPVDISEFENPHQDKKKQVITISRFSQEKNLDFALQVMKKIDTNYLLIGNTKTKTNEIYFKKLQSFCRNKEISSKINLLKNIPRSKIIQNLVNSKVYFHSSDETFGISVVEAIAAGCIPIVPNNSAHIETVSPKELRYIPNDINDAVDKILRALKGEFDTLIDPLQKTISKYSKENFKKSFTNYLENISI